MLIFSSGVTFTNSFCEGSLKPFAHFCIHGRREDIILIKIMYFVIHTAFAFFYGSLKRFAHFILLHKMMIDKISILSDLRKLVF